MKKVLIVSPYFAPENSVASIRFTKISKYLNRAGYNITVICTQMNAKWMIDKTLEKDIAELNDVVRIRYPEQLYYAFKKKWELENGQIKNEEKRNTNNRVKNSIAWAYAYCCNVLLGKYFIDYIRQRKETYDVVITTYSPIAGHILGNYMKKHKLCTTWIEDFRDPLTAHWNQSFVTALTHFHGAMLMRRADYITVVSRGGARSLFKEARIFGVKIEDRLKIISNGYDPEDRNGLMTIETEMDKLIFSYCGSIYEIDGKIKNDISPFFGALSDLVANGQIEKENIEVQYAGSGWLAFQAAAEKYGMEDILCNNGNVSRDESLRLQRKSDIVIAAVWNNKGETGLISGKFFETLLIQRNVLAIVSGNQPDSELAAIIRELRCGFAYEEAYKNKCNMEQTKKWILEKYQEKMATGKLSYSESAKAERYSHEYLAKKFEKLF